MSRVVNTNSPGKRRSYHMRSCAELVRRLSQKQTVDEEARDMLAALVYALRQMDSSLDEAVAAWEKRDYWVKAEKFRQKWYWVGAKADELASVLLSQDWNSVPQQIMSMVPLLADVTINKFTRTPTLWNGMYDRFLKENG